MLSRLLEHLTEAQKIPNRNSVFVRNVGSSCEQLQSAGWRRQTEGQSECPSPTSPSASCLCDKWRHTASQIHTNLSHHGNPQSSSDYKKYSCTYEIHEKGVKQQELRPPPAAHPLILRLHLQPSRNRQKQYRLTYPGSSLNDQSPKGQGSLRNPEHDQHVSSCSLSRYKHVPKMSLKSVPNLSDKQTLTTNNNKYFYL